MKKILAISWITILVTLFVLQSHFKAETTVFMGITDDSGQAISFEYPIEIVELNTVEGQKVAEGDVLLKVRRSNLESKQAILSEKIHELDFRNQSSMVSIQAEIKSLRARKAAEQADLNVQIQKLRAQYRTNIKLLADITGSAESANDTDNPFLEQIAVLKKQRSYIGRSIQAQIDSLRSQISSNNRPIHAQMNELKERRTELDRQVTELVVKADLSGQVGSVLYKAGETVNAFQPILNIHVMYPELVKGYINENVYNKVKAGQQVWVSSVALNGEAIAFKGIVENVGNRIVDYPQRLKKNVLVPAWGREVVVRLDNENRLLLGERVNIGLRPPQPSLSRRAVAYIKGLLVRNKEETDYAVNM